MRWGDLAGRRGGFDYTTVAKTVSRFGKRPAQDKVLESKFERIEMNCPNSRYDPSALTGGNTVCIHKRKAN